MRVDPIKAFALLCVAGNSIFFAVLASWLVRILSSPDWCGKALQANRITPGSSFTGLTACMDLLKLQVDSLSRALLIVIGTFAVCLGVLVIIVIADARFSGKFANAEVDVDKETNNGNAGNLSN